MTDFEPGDVVALNSGGPPMTVSRQYGSRIGVVWFDDHAMREATLYASQVFLLDEIEPDTACTHLTLVKNDDT